MQFTSFIVKHGEFIMDSLNGWFSRIALISPKNIYELGHNSL